MVALAVAACVAAGCGPKLRKLDEATLYAGPAFTLKVTRYYENLPLHYTGEIFVLTCSSDRTKTATAGPTNEAGWVMVDRGGAIGSKSASEVVERVRSDYRVIDDRILAWSRVLLSVSFDGCGSFQTWDPTTLPRDLIDPAPRPDWCAPKGTADCRYEDFQGDRLPRYVDVTASADGHVSFRMESKALKPGAAVQVSSGDFGRTWDVRGL
jgi:hypothetical protein